MQKTKKTKKQIKVQDLKPKKDAKVGINPSTPGGNQPRQYSPGGNHPKQYGPQN